LSCGKCLHILYSLASVHSWGWKGRHGGGCKYVPCPPAVCGNCLVNPEPSLNLKGGLTPGSLDHPPQLPMWS
jgi:hypothetical protein